MSCCRQPLPGEEVSTELPGNHRKLLKASCCLILIQVQHSPKTPSQTLLVPPPLQTPVGGVTPAASPSHSWMQLCCEMAPIHSYKSCFASCISVSTSCLPAPPVDFKIEMMIHIKTDFLWALIKIYKYYFHTSKTPPWGLSGVISQFSIISHNLPSCYEFEWICSVWCLNINFSEHFKGILHRIPFPIITYDPLEVHWWVCPLPVFSYCVKRQRHSVFGIFRLQPLVTRCQTILYLYHKQHTYNEVKCQADKVC